MIVISEYDENEMNISNKIMELIDGGTILTQKVNFKSDSLGNLRSKEIIDYIKDTTYISKFISIKVNQNIN